MFCCGANLLSELKSIFSNPSASKPYGVWGPEKVSGWLQKVSRKEFSGWSLTFFLNDLSQRKFWKGVVECFVAIFS